MLMNGNSILTKSKAKGNKKAHIYKFNQSIDTNTTKKKIVKSLSIKVAGFTKLNLILNPKK